jgi:hypothetical protein
MKSSLMSLHAAMDCVEWNFKLPAGYSNFYSIKQNFVQCNPYIQILKQAILFHCIRKYYYPFKAKVHLNNI